jgi:hypothetical protein
MKPTGMACVLSVLACFAAAADLYTANLCKWETYMGLGDVRNDSWSFAGIDRREVVVQRKDSAPQSVVIDTLALTKRELAFFQAA